MNKQKRLITINAILKQYLAKIPYQLNEIILQYNRININAFKFLKKTNYIIRDSSTLKKREMKTALVNGLYLDNINPEKLLIIHPIFKNFVITKLNKYRMNYLRTNYKLYGKYFTWLCSDGEHFYICLYNYKTDKLKQIKYNKSIIMMFIFNEYIIMLGYIRRDLYLSIYNYHGHLKTIKICMIGWGRNPKACVFDNYFCFCCKHDEMDNYYYFGEN